MRPSFTLTQPRSWIPQMLSKLNLTPVEMQLDRGQVRSRSLPSHRWRPLCVLFVHLDANVMEACTQELKKAQFTVKSDFVLNLAQSANQLRVQPADVMIVDYPSPACKESQVLQLVHGSVHGLPIIFLTSGMGTESIAALTRNCAVNWRMPKKSCGVRNRCIERWRTILPMASIGATPMANCLM